MANQIICFYITDKQTYAALVTGDVLNIQHTLCELEKMAMPWIFYRCHSKNLVNLSHIKRYTHKTGQLVLTNDRQIKVACDRKAAFKKLIYKVLAEKP